MGRKVASDMLGLIGSLLEGIQFGVSIVIITSIGRDNGRKAMTKLQLDTQKTI